MIGLNPWNLKKDKFCLMWFESSNCLYEDIIKGKTNTKNADIKRIYLLKIRCSKEGVYVIGKWDRDEGNNKAWLLDLSKFVEDSYLVTLHGSNYSFSIINENLGVHKLNYLDKENLIDIEDTLEWVENKSLVDERLKKINEILDGLEEVSEKMLLFKDWFVEYLWPLLKDGFR